MNPRNIIQLSSSSLFCFWYPGCFVSYVNSKFVDRGIQRTCYEICWIQFLHPPLPPNWKLLLPIEQESSSMEWTEHHDPKYSYGFMSEDMDIVHQRIKALKHPPLRSTLDTKVPNCEVHWPCHWCGLWTTSPMWSELPMKWRASIGGWLTS